MRFPVSCQLLLAAVFLAACHSDDPAPESPQLRPGTFRHVSLANVGPVRCFTRNGEISSPAAIAAFVRHQPTVRLLALRDSVVTYSDPTDTLHVTADNYLLRYSRRYAIGQPAPGSLRLTDPDTASYTSGADPYLTDLYLAIQATAPAYVDRRVVASGPYVGAVAYRVQSIIPATLVSTAVLHLPQLVVMVGTTNAFAARPERQTVVLRNEFAAAGLSQLRPQDTLAVWPFVDVFQR